MQVAIEAIGAFRLQLKIGFHLDLFETFVVSSFRKLGVKRAKDVLELIHINLYGPFPTASWNGQQYFITFIDYYSRYDYLYLIHKKSQSLDIFKSFKAEVEFQLGKKIKAIKSNLGGEYYGRYDESGEQHLGPFALFLRECGIILQYTMPGKLIMNNQRRILTKSNQLEEDVQARRDLPSRLHPGQNKHPSRGDSCRAGSVLRPNADSKANAIQNRIHLDIKRPTPPRQIQARA
ncbi:hypothetical protein CR513_07486, partial [Mucuna pruriens]